MNREDLKNYNYKQKWIKQQIDYFEEQRTTILRITQVLDSMPKAQNKPNDALEELMDNINEFIKDYKKQQDELNNINKELAKIKPLYANILYDIYIKSMNLEETSADIKYSYNKTCTFHGLALDEFDKLETKVGNF